MDKAVSLKLAGSYTTQVRRLVAALVPLLGLAGMIPLAGCSADGPASAPSPVVDAGASDAGGEDAGTNSEAGVDGGPKACQDGYVGCAAGCCEAIVDLSSRGAASCIVTARGSVKCWGDNSVGQLGDGTRTNRLTPGLVKNISNARSVATGTGDLHTCAVLADGGLRCWGSNQLAQLGDGTRTDSTTPVVVQGTRATPVTGVVAVAPGENHTCALFTTGKVDCWGPVGNYGDASAAGTLSNVTSLGAGANFTCALAGGGVTCMGFNPRGMLGDGSTMRRTSGVSVVGIAGATHLSTGVVHSCAVVGGAVACWGQNHGGQVGDPTFADALTPFAVPAVTTAIDVSVGGGHSCALLAGGGVMCWGNNTTGQLGDGTMEPRTSPVAVKGLSNAKFVSAGLGHTCALRLDNSVVCWGVNNAGQLGDGTTTTRPAPTPVTGL